MDLRLSVAAVLLGRRIANANAKVKVNVNAKNRFRLGFVLTM
jgi:hypothetical protein